MTRDNRLDHRLPDMERARGGGPGSAHPDRLTRLKNRRPASAAKKRQHDRTRLLATRRETAATAFRKSVPRPEYRLPKRSKPQWNDLDLNQKLPVFQNRKCPVVFHRGPMGSNPFRVANDRDARGRPRFSLDDPYMRDVSYKYNALHDPHLKGWLLSSGTCAHLRRQGLVTEDLDVVCTLKEHNEYRRFLGRRHDDAIAAAAREQNARDIEYNRIAKAVAAHRSDMEKLLRRCKGRAKKRVKTGDGKKTKRSKAKPGPDYYEPNPRMTEGLFDIHELKTYTEFGRRPDGRPDYSKYEGTYMKGDKGDYRLLPGGERFFDRPSQTDGRRTAKETGRPRTKGAGRGRKKCRIVKEDPKFESMRKALVECYREDLPITLKERIKILTSSKKYVMAALSR